MKHMRPPRLWGSAAAGLVALAAATLLSSGVATATSQPTFTIRSSLDGKTVLPQRIRWIAYPSGSVNFPGVEFLIDGKVVYANRLAPYAFGSDAKDEATGKVNTGYLVTTWLAPGSHRFTVRAKGSGAYRGLSAERTVVARVRPAPAPPAGLTGTWERELTAPVPPDRNVLFRGLTAPPGTYRIAIGRGYVRMSGPDPRPHTKVDYVAGPRVITFRGPVWTGDPDEDAICEPWGPEAGYSWTVDGDTLTLAPARPADTCKQRAALTTGEWTRVG